MPFDTPKSEGWSVSLVAIVLSTVVTVVAWIAAAEAFLSDPRAGGLMRPAEDLGPRAQVEHLNRSEALSGWAGIVVLGLILVAAAILFFWMLWRGVYVSPPLVVSLVGATAASAGVLCVFAYQAALLLPHMLQVITYILIHRIEIAITYVVVLNVIWIGAVQLNRLEKRLNAR